MTTRKPPGPPPVPGLGTYRPSQERGQQPQQQPAHGHAAGTPQHPRAPEPQWGQAQPGSPPHHDGPYGHPPPQRMAAPHYGGARPPGQQMPPPRQPPQGRRSNGPPPGGGGGFRGLVFVGLALIGLLAGGAAWLVFAAPTDLIRDQLIARVKAKTGRDLVIAGPSSFSIYPSIGMTMADVTLSAPPDMKARPLVAMKNLTVNVALMPLIFQREVKVERLVLTEPDINLEVDGAGRSTWQFAAAIQDGTVAPVRLAQAPAAGGTMTDAASPAMPVPAVQPSRLAFQDIELKDVRIENGKLTFSDARKGARETLEKIDLRMALPSMGATLDTTGTVAWRGETLDIAGQVTSVRALLEEEPAKVVASVRGRPLNLSYDGTLAVKSAVDAEGDFALSSPSVSALAAFAGTSAPPISKPGVLDLKGKLRAANNTYTLSGATAQLDQAKAAGDLAVTMGAQRPVIKANLKLAELDLNAFLDGATAAVTPASKPPAAAPPAAPAKTPGPQSAPQSIDDLLKGTTAPDGPQVRGFTQRLGLSTEPIDWTPLAAADAEITLDVTRLTYGSLLIDKAAGTAGLDSSALNIWIGELAALGGKGSGSLTLDARQPAAALTANFNFDGLGVAPVARLAGIEAMSGSGTLSGRIAMTGSGASERQIADTLSGPVDLTISKGAISYAAAGATHQVTGLNATLGVTSLNGPLAAKGGLVWNGEPLAIDATLNTLAQLADARPVSLKGKIEGTALSAAYEGTLAYAGGFGAKGAVSLKTRSLRNVAGWLGTAMPEGPGFGPFDLSGKVAASEGRYVLSGARIAMDGDTATGEIALDTRPERPAVTATLRLSGLDLNKYLAEAGTAQPKKSASAAAVPAATGTLAPAKTKAPEVRGYTQRGGWSQEPYDMSALGLADVDARLSIGRLLYKKIKVGQSQLNIGLKNSALKTTFDDVQLYGGRGKGFISIDGTRPQTPSIGTNLTFDGVDAQPLLKDAADLDWLAGKGKLAIAVAGQGASQRALIDALSGKADLTFTDGAIVGINIPGLVRNVSQGKLSGLKSAPTEKTDFSTFTSTWAIAGGVAQNQDLQLLSPLLRVTGAGKVMLGQQQLDYLLRPKLVSELAGQGGNQALGGLEIPVRVSGAWEKPAFTPDLKGVDLNKAVDQIKEIGKQLKGDKGKELLKDLFGGRKSAPADGAAAPADAPPAAEAPAAPAKKPSKTEQLLEEFLRQ